jgi:hypothetical protein
LSAQAEGRCNAPHPPKAQASRRDRPCRHVLTCRFGARPGWGKPKEMHHSEVDDNKTLLKVVNEIVHVYETREQIEFNDQTPLLEINPSKNGGNTH